MKSKQDVHPLSGFFTHGVHRNGQETGNQYIANCVFCQREGKFYINRENMCWDCKVCGAKGNYVTFLKDVAAMNLKNMDDNATVNLATDRGLPKSAFDGYGIGWDGEKYTLPITDSEGKFISLKNFYVNFKTNRMQIQKGTKPFLYGSHKLRQNLDGVVYLCEGEWDVIAMNWLIRKLGKDAVAIAVPSAHTFPVEWAEYFYKRKVVCMYDNDDAGRDGEEKVYNVLQPVVASIAFVHWPTSRPEGFDSNDFVSEVAFRYAKPKRCWKEIHQMVHKVPRKIAGLATTGPDGKLEIADVEETLEPISFADLVKSFKSYLYFKDSTPLKVVLATIFANRIDGEMIWMFIVAPPSSAKTEFIQSLNLLKNTVPISRFTTHTLSSGFIQGGAKKEVSLLPKLNGKVALVKDFTGVLTMHPKDQDDIFGQLRDAYDGETDYYFGHGQNKHYKSKFGLIAGVTEVIERVNGSGNLHTALGERFLRYRIPKDVVDAANIDNSDFMHKAQRAMKNTGHETVKRQEIMHNVKRFFEADQKEFIAEMPEDMAQQLKYLAWFTARMRGFVDRDQKSYVNYMPGAESPIRLLKQLYRMAVGLARVENKREVDQRDMNVLRRIALDTCPSRIELFVRKMHEADAPLQHREIAKRADFDETTVGMVMKDLQMLKIVKMDQVGGQRYYALSEFSKELIRKGGIYPSTEEARVVSERRQVHSPRRKWILSQSR